MTDFTDCGPLFPKETEDIPLKYISYILGINFKTTSKEI